MADLDLDRDVAGHAVRQIYQDFRVALTGVVRSFAAPVSRAVVRFVVRFTGTDMKPHDEPDAQDVPVIYPSGGGYGLWFPMEEDDPVVVLAQDGAPFGFYDSGQPAQTKAGGASHTYGCAVAFPGGRVSNTAVPTLPPNDPGTGLTGSVDKTAAVIFRGAGKPTPAELGTVAVVAANPAGGVLLGTDDPLLATLGAARLTDPVAASVDGAALLNAMATSLASLGFPVPPPVLAAGLANLGTISGASAKVMLEP